jgi:hypothetical protein
MGPRKDLRLVGEEDPEVVKITNGELHLNAVRDVDSVEGEKQYKTCYSIATRSTMNFQYGYVEMRGYCLRKIPNYNSIKQEYGRFNKFKLDF